MSPAIAPFPFDPEMLCARQAYMRGNPDVGHATRQRWLEEEAAVRRRLAGSDDAIPTRTLARRPGIELLRAIVDGELPPPPIGRVLDYVLIEIEHGCAVFQGTPKYDYYSPIGSVHGGWAATLLDSCVACAVLSTLPAGKGLITLELNVNFVRALSDET